MAAEKVVRVKFDGSSKGLAAAAAAASKVTERWSKQLDKVKAKAETWGRSGDTAGKGFAAGAARALGSLVGAAADAGKRMMGAVSGAVDAGGPYLKAALVAAAISAGVAASAAIGAAITAGILLAVGGGVIALGIKQAMSDPKVAAAWKGFGDRAKTALAGFSEPFKAPLIGAADTFAASVERMAPSIKRMGDSLAPLIDKLAPAIADMAEKMMPGLERAAIASKPLFDVLAKHAPRIGTAMSKFFGSISEGAPGATLFLDHALTWLEGIIIFLGVVIGWLSKLYVKVTVVAAGLWEAFRTAVRFILDALGMVITGAAKAFGWIPGLGGKLKTAAEEFNAFKTKVNRALAGIKDKTVGVDVAIRVTGNKNSSAVAHALRKQNIPGFARGGWARGMYLAGENGPELIASGGGRGAADRVHSNRETQSMLSPEVHVYIGDQELRGIVRVEMSGRDRGVKRRVLAGSGAGR